MAATLAQQSAKSLPIVSAYERILQEVNEVHYQLIGDNNILNRSKMRHSKSLRGNVGNWCELQTNY